MQKSAMDTLKGLLGDNADEKIKAALSTLSASGDSTNTEAANESATPTVVPGKSAFDPATAESLMQIKSIVDNFANSGNDSRANLLMSLKPYMRSSRQTSIDTAIRILNLSKLSGIFKLR